MPDWEDIEEIYEPYIPPKTPSIPSKQGAIEPYWPPEPTFSQAEREYEEQASLLYGLPLRELNRLKAYYPDEEHIWDIFHYYITSGRITEQQAGQAWRYMSSPYRESSAEREEKKKEILGSDSPILKKVVPLMELYKRSGWGLLGYQEATQMVFDYLKLTPKEQKQQKELQYNLDVVSGETEGRPVAPRTAYEPYTGYEPAPTPRYEPAFEAMRAGLGGTQPWKDWFESKYSTLLRRFKTTLPAELPPAEEAERTWAEWLKKQKPELKEQWWGLGAYQRGERPAAFAPRVRTVKF